MPTKAKTAFPKLYIKLSDLATKWGLDVAELLHYAVEGRLAVVVHHFDAIQQDGDVEYAEEDSSSEIESEFEPDPPWALSLVPDAIKKIAIAGEVTIGRGLRRGRHGMEQVPFNQDRKITVNDLVVLPEEIEQHEKLAATLGNKEKSNLQKQIGALAMVIAKTSSNPQLFKSGTKLNASAIAKAVEKEFANTQATLKVTLDNSGMKNSELRDNITEGLGLIEK